MKISFVIPAFNSASFIAETLRSIEEQSIKPFEVLVVDDGSTDETIKLARQFNVKIYSNPINHGIGYSRQFGAMASKGSHVAFLSSDDVILSSFLEKSIPYLEEGGATFSNYMRWMFPRNYYQPFDMPLNFSTQAVFRMKVVDWALRKNMFVNFSSVIIPRSWFESIAFLPLRHGEDLIFLLDSILQGMIWRYVPHKLLHYRIHKDQVTRHLNREYFDLLWTYLNDRLLKLGVDQPTINISHVESMQRAFPSLPLRIYRRLKASLP